MWLRIQVFWNVKLCRKNGFPRLKDCGTFIFHRTLGDEHNTIIRNVGKHSHNDTASHRRGLKYYSFLYQVYNIDIKIFR
jgi:hypothetical protein